MKLFLLLCTLFSSVFSSEDPLKTQIGEMVMMGFCGYECPEVVAKQLEQGRIGGFVLYDFDCHNGTFAKNIASKEQLRALCEELNQKSLHKLWIAIDQEGGKVNRLKPDYGFPATISQQQLGESNNLTATREQSEITSQMLLKVGINVNLAPVLDLNIVPTSSCIGLKQRSFSVDPVTVAAHAEQVIIGHHLNGVMCVLKHFPGHGCAGEDTHEGFVDVTKTWSPTELEPYKSLLAANVVDMIMIAHTYNANIDAVNPASLSKNIVTGLLRDDLGFDGVVVSDDLQMLAITKFYTLEETVEKSLNAGVDVLMFGNQHSEYDQEIADKVVNIIYNLVETNKIERSRIEQSLTRISRLKGKPKDFAEKI